MVPAFSALFKKYSTLIYILALTLTAGGALFPSTKSTWVFNDDYQQFAENPLVLESGHWSDFFTRNTGEVLSPPKRSSIYRPIYLLTYKFEARTWGLSPFVTRLVNLAIHLTLTLTLFFTIRSFTCARNAWIGSMLFSLHPIVAEPVAWSSGRHELMLGLGVALLLYVLQRKEPIWAWPLILVGGLVKETFLPVAASLMAIYCYFMWTEYRRSFLPMRKKDILAIALALMSFLAVIMIRYQVLREWFFGFPSFSIVGRNLLFTLARYFEVLLLPWRSGVFMADIHSPIGLARLFCLGLGCLGLLGIVISLFKPREDDALSFKLMSLSVFFVPLFTVSLVADLAGHIHDRYFYVSHLALSMMAGTASPRGDLSSYRKYFFTTVFLGLLGGLIYLSFVSSRHWQTYPQTIQRILEETPTNPQVYLEAAQFSLRVNDPYQAKKHLRSLLERSPQNTWARNVLAVLLIYHRELDEALVHLKQAYAIDPRSPDTSFNLGFYFENKGDVPKAKESYEQTLQLNPHHGKAREALDRLDRQKQK